MTMLTGPGFEAGLFQGGDGATGQGASCSRHLLILRVTTRGSSCIRRGFARKQDGRRRQRMCMPASGHLWWGSDLLLGGRVFWFLSSFKNIRMCEKKTKTCVVHHSPKAAPLWPSWFPSWPQKNQQASKQGPRRWCSTRMGWRRPE